MVNRIIYAVTVIIQKDVELAWLEYMKEHVADVINTNCFMDYSFRKGVPADFDSDDLRKITNMSSVYCIEYHTDTLDRLNKYLKNFAPKLQDDHSRRFSGKFNASRMIYEDKFWEWHPPVDWNMLAEKVKNIPA